MPFPQALFPFTVMFPVTAEGPNATVIELVVLDPVAPFGKVHIYDVALAIGETEYITLLCPWQTFVKPVIVPAATGNGLTTIAFIDAIPSPQMLLPLTEIFPDIAVLLKFTVIEDVELLPFTPLGKVQM